MATYYRTRRRKPADGCCPTCGRKAEMLGQVFLDMDRRIVSRCAQHVHLSQLEILILKELLDSWPRHVAFERLAYVAWGDHPPKSASEEVDRPYNYLQVMVSHMRKKLAPLGIVIPRGERYTCGYVVELDPIPRPILRAVS